MIKVILFDLDGTLYNSTEVRKKFAQAAYHALAKLKNIPVDEATTLIEDTRERLKEKLLCDRLCLLRAFAGSGRAITMNRAITKVLRSHFFKGLLEFMIILLVCSFSVLCIIGRWIALFYSWKVYFSIPLVPS